MALSALRERKETGPTWGLEEAETRGPGPLVGLAHSSAFTECLLYARPETRCQEVVPSKSALGPAFTEGVHSQNEVHSGSLAAGKSAMGKMAGCYEKALPWTPT